MLQGQFYPAPAILKGIRKEGLFDFQKLPEAEIEFFSPFDVPMFERYANTPNAVRERKENSIVLHLENLTEYEAAQLVLSTCGNAKVHAPDSLKLYMRRIANKILDHLEN